jgi:hypothetical protein
MQRGLGGWLWRMLVFILEKLFEVMVTAVMVETNLCMRYTNNSAQAASSRPPFL